MQHTEYYARAEEGGEDNQRKMSLRPGYSIRPGNDKSYQVPTVLADEQMALASIEIPEFSAVSDKDGGVSDPIILSQAQRTHPAQLISSRSTESRPYFI